MNDEVKDVTPGTKDDFLLQLLLFSVGIFNVIDYFLTLYAIENGFREGNPIIELIVDTVYFAKLKLILVPLMLILLWIRRNHVRKRMNYYVWIIFIAYLGLMLYYIALFQLGFL